MRGKSLVLALCLALSANAGHAETANPANAAATSLTVEGTLVSSSATSLDIEKTNGARMSFSLAPEANLPRDLALGSTVSVTYTTIPSGSLEAHRVVPLATSPAPASSAVAAESTSGTPATGSAQDPYGSSPRSSSNAQSLPKTASTMPLLALFGVTLLAAALWLRFFCQRVPER